MLNGNINAPILAPSTRSLLERVGGRASHINNPSSSSQGGNDVIQARIDNIVNASPADAAMIQGGYGASPEINAMQMAAAAAAANPMMLQELMMNQMAMMAAMGMMNPAAFAMQGKRSQDGIGRGEHRPPARDRQRCAEDRHGALQEPGVAGATERQWHGAVYFRRGFAAIETNQTDHRPAGMKHPHAPVHCGVVQVVHKIDKVHAASNRSHTRCRTAGPLTRTSRRRCRGGPGKRRAIEGGSGSVGTRQTLQPVTTGRCVGT